MPFSAAKDGHHRPKSHPQKSVNLTFSYICIPHYKMMHTFDLSGKKWILNRNFI
jgi:hypothetical protein